MTDLGKHECGPDGLRFPNGLPDDGEQVQVKTVWSGGEWQDKRFCEQYGHEKRHQYNWFGCFSKPDVANGSMPIVLEWRYPPKINRATPL